MAFGYVATSTKTSVSVLKFVATGVSNVATSWVELIMLTRVTLAPGNGASYSPPFAARCSHSTRRGWTWSGVPNVHEPSKVTVSPLSAIMSTPASEV